MALAHKLGEEKAANASKIMHFLIMNCRLSVAIAYGSGRFKARSVMSGLSSFHQAIVDAAGTGWAR
jgi:hypothetical protein